jgi:hypothetical protein
VRELRTLGSVRGALSNGCLYRDWPRGYWVWTTTWLKVVNLQASPFKAGWLTKGTVISFFAFLPAF